MLTTGIINGLQSSTVVLFPSGIFPMLGGQSVIEKPLHILRLDAFGPPTFLYKHSPERQLH